MSNRTPPQLAYARNPRPTDDSSKGIIVGSVWVNTTVVPRAAFISMDDTPGAAVWAVVGAPGAHAAWTLLDWPSSAHEATTTSVAAFTSAGAAAAIQASSDDQYLTRSGGNLVFASFNNVITFGPSTENGYVASYVPLDTALVYADGTSIHPIGDL